MSGRAGVCTSHHAVQPLSRLSVYHSHCLECSRPPHLPGSGFPHFLRRLDLQPEAVPAPLYRSLLFSAGSLIFLSQIREHPRPQTSSHCRPLIAAAKRKSIQTWNSALKYLPTCFLNTPVPRLTAWLVKAGI